MLNPNNQVNIHNESTPIFFRNFVEALFRLYYLRSKLNLQQAIRMFESSVANHLFPIMQGVKTAKPILHDEAFYENKLNSFSSEVEILTSNLARYRLSTRRPGQYLTLDCIVQLLGASGEDSRGQAFPTLLGVFEANFDAEESVKKADLKIRAIAESSSPLRGQGRVPRYEEQKARLINAKRGAEQFDRDWASILLVFCLRESGVTVKDKKFDAKAKPAVAAFCDKISAAVGKAVGGNRTTHPDRKVKARRWFPQSQKDYE